MRQGEIWWCRLPGAGGDRPVLILTRSSVIPHRSNLTVAPITRTIRGIAAEVELLPADGVPSRCAISLDDLQTVKKHTLNRRITTLTREKMNGVFQAIRFVFDMP